MGFTLDRNVAVIFLYYIYFIDIVAGCLGVDWYVCVLTLCYAVLRQHLTREIVDRRWLLSGAGCSLDIVVHVVDVVAAATMIRVCFVFSCLVNLECDHHCE